MITTIRNRLLLALALLCPAAACTGDDATSEGGSDTASSSSTSSTSAATETTGMSASSTTDASSSTSTGDSAGGMTDSEGSSTGTTADSGDSDTTDTTGTTGGDAAIQTSCETACEVLVACVPDQWESLEQCVEACVTASTPPAPDADCEAANIALNECIGAAECADLEGEDLCTAESDAASDACDDGGDICSGSAGTNPEGTECLIGEECPDYKHELLCNEETCTCFEDDVMTAVCPQEMNLCADFDPSVLDDIGATCCGW